MQNYVNQIIHADSLNILKQLPDKCIDLILSGSGTTAIACYKLKRNFICIEKDEAFYKASIERLKNEENQNILF